MFTCDHYSLVVLHDTTFSRYSFTFAKLLHTSKTPQDLEDAETQLSSHHNVSLLKSLRSLQRPMFPIYNASASKTDSSLAAYYILLLDGCPRSEISVNVNHLTCQCF